MDSAITPTRRFFFSSWFSLSLNKSKLHYHRVACTWCRVDPCLGQRRGRAYHHPHTLPFPSRPLGDYPTHVHHDVVLRMEMKLVYSVPEPGWVGQGLPGSLTNVASTCHFPVGRNLDGSGWVRMGKPTWVYHTIGERHKCTHVGIWRRVWSTTRRTY